MEDKFFEAKYPAFSREKEIGQILTYIKSGNSSQIISIPGAGRSTLLGLLAYNKHVREYHLKDDKERYHFVMVDFSEIHQKPTIEAIKLIFLNIVSSLEDRDLDGAYEKAKHIMQESLSFHDELVLFQGLKKTIDILAFEKNLTVILLFDQFDKYIPMLTADFFTNLRTLHNRAKYKFSIVFSLYKPFEYLLEPSLFADFSEFIEGNTVFLALHDEPSLSFRINYIETMMQKTLDDSTKHALLTLTAGHSKLTRTGVHILLDNDVPKDLQEFLLSQKQITSLLSDIWQTLNPAEQTHFLKQLYPSVLDDEHSSYLQQVGLMSHDATSLPLFEAFTNTLRAQQSMQPQTILFDATTNIIKKGDQEISDKLTATEFRLLTFFLNHPNTVLERNMIIQGVWKENKTVLGVTDQALDQLIFRLRRKIEEDPNNPTHLKTIKGRGFSFSP